MMNILKKFFLLVMVLFLISLGACDDASDDSTDSTDDSSGSSGTTQSGTFTGKLTFVDATSTPVAASLYWQVFLLTQEQYTSWSAANGDPTSYATAQTSGTFASTATANSVTYTIESVAAGSYFVLGCAWVGSSAEGDPAYFGSNATSGIATLAAEGTTTVDITASPMASSTTTSYSVKFTVDGTSKDLTKGISGMNDGNALASYDGSVTTIYAYEEAIPFAELNSTNKTGFRLSDISLNTTGTVTNAEMVYQENGTLYQATNVTVTITTYGAVGETVVGTFGTATVSDGSTTKTIGSGTFTVINHGNE